MNPIERQQLELDLQNEIAEMGDWVAGRKSHVNQYSAGTQTVEAYAQMMAAIDMADAAEVTKHSAAVQALSAVLRDDRLINIAIDAALPEIE
jgi:hypothetical protein